MGLKNLVSSVLIGILCLKGVGGTCSRWSGAQTNKVATMCTDSVVEGTEVYIDTNLAGTTTLERGTTCTCDVQTQRGKELKVWSYFDGVANSKCGTSVDFTGKAIGDRTILSTPCYSYQFNVETHTYTNISVGFRMGNEPYTSSYCVQLELTSCSDTEHQCGDGSCIPFSNKCDNLPDCEDHSDELACSSVVCVEGQVACDDGTFCINRNEICNNEYDCPDQSDESHCGSNFTESGNPSSTGSLPPPLIKVTCVKSMFLPPPTTTTTTTSSTTTTTPTETTTTTTPATTTSTTTPVTTSTTTSTTSSSTTTATTTPTKTSTTSPTTSTTTVTSSVTTTTSPTTTTTSSPNTTSTTTATDVSTTTSTSTSETSTTPITTTSTTSTSTTSTPTSTTTTFTPTTTTLTPATTTSAPNSSTTTLTTTTTTAPTTITTTTTPKSTTTTIQSTPSTTSTIAASTSTSTTSSSTTSTSQPTTTTEATTTTTTTTTEPTTTQPTTPKPRCNATSQFECGNGSCIPLSWRCDRTEDCNDKSDEKACSTYICGPNMFLCDEWRTCIKSSERCDGKSQCPDLSDESLEYCDKPTAAPSSKDDFDNTAIIIGCIAGGLFLIATLFCIVYWTRSSKWNRRTDGYTMKQESEITGTPDIAYVSPTLHTVLPPAEKTPPTHVWYPSPDQNGDILIPDVYDVDQLDQNTGEKRFILIQ